MKTEASPEASPGPSFEPRFEPLLWKITPWRVRHLGDESVLGRKRWAVMLFAPAEPDSSWLFYNRYGEGESPSEAVEAAMKGEPRGVMRKSQGEPESEPRSKPDRNLPRRTSLPEFEEGGGF